MELAALLARLSALLVDPWVHLPAICRLLEAHQELAEHEVARFLVMKAIRPGMEPRLRSLDPRERLGAVRLVPWVYPRAMASDTLRRSVKDPDRSVRGAAQTAVVALGLSDVALPDTRYSPSKIPSILEGGWNVSGWLMGLAVEDERPERRVPAQARAARKALPALASREAVADLVGWTSPLAPLLRPGTGRGAAYVAFSIPKAGGGTRTIAAPIAPLKRVQRVLLEKLLDPLPVHDACHGFVRGRSVVSNARPHAGARLILKTDLRDFFPSIHFRRVRGLFEQYGYRGRVAGLLAALTTQCPTLPDGRVVWPGVLPQGAPTSPAIANLVCRRLDARLSGLARSAGGVYTRYADDLTFSFPSEPSLGVGRFFWWIDQVCQQEGFEENRAKRRVLRPHQRQQVTGVVVNDSPAAPRKLRRLLRAVVHNCQTHGVPSQSRGDEGFFDRLRGMAAYIHMVQPGRGALLLREIAALPRGSARR